MSVEDFGNADNLMIDACLAEQGRPLIRFEGRTDELFAALDGFEACLRMAAREFDRDRAGGGRRDAIGACARRAPLADQLRSGRTRVRWPILRPGRASALP